MPVILDDAGEPMGNAAGIAAARHRLGMTQRGMAEVCGVSVRTVQDWEQGRNAVPATAINAVGVSLAAMGRGR